MNNYTCLFLCQLALCCVLCAVHEKDSKRFFGQYESTFNTWPFSYSIFIEKQILKNHPHFSLLFDG